MSQGWEAVGEKLAFHVWGWSRSLDRMVWRAPLDICLEIYAPPTVNGACNLSLEGEDMSIPESSLLQLKYYLEGRTLNHPHLEL